jgi:hypothetical protein
MRRANELTRQRVTADNTDWELPLGILSEAVRHDGLGAYVRPGLCNGDLVEEVLPRAYTLAPFAPAWQAFHWCNEYLMERRYPKDRPPYFSRLRQTCREHGLAPGRPALRVSWTAVRYRRAGASRRALLRAAWRRLRGRAPT